MLLIIFFIVLLIFLQETVQISVLEATNSHSKPTLLNPAVAKFLMCCFASKHTHYCYQFLSQEIKFWIGCSPTNSPGHFDFEMRYELQIAVRNTLFGRLILFCVIFQ